MFMNRKLQKNHLSENQMLKFCMNSNSLKVLRVTCSYINNCLTLRNEIIQPNICELDPHRPVRCTR
jgi:hypothetical protein